MALLLNNSTIYPTLKRRPQKDTLHITSIARRLGRIRAPFLETMPIDAEADVIRRHAHISATWSEQLVR